MKVSIFHKADSLLAEGPYWSKFHSELFWVDILKKGLFRKSMQGELVSYSLPETLTSFFVKESIVYGCTNSGYCSFNLETKQFDRIIEIEANNPTNRSNDGKYDGHGGFVFGTMDWGGEKRSGSIYHVDTVKLQCTLLDTGYYIPNGFAFSNDSRELLIADSYIGIIYKYDYDPDKKLLMNKRVFSDISATGFCPDGMATSKQNHIWNAEWDGARLTQYNFNGDIVSRITLQVLRPTSCAFGGAEDRLLYITSARAEMSESQLKKYPDSGSIFCLDISN